MCVLTLKDKLPTFYILNFSWIITFLYPGLFNISISIRLLSNWNPFAHNASAVCEVGHKDLASLKIHPIFLGPPDLNI